MVFQSCTGKSKAYEEQCKLIGEDMEHFCGSIQKHIDEAKNDITRITDGDSFNNEGK